MKKYLLITFIWSWVLWLPGVLNSAEIGVPEIFLAIGMLASIGPSFAGLFLVWRDGGNRGLLDLLKRAVRFGSLKQWLPLVLLLMPAAAAISYGIAHLITGESGEPLTFGVIITLVVMFFVGGPLGEEFGWRGYALEKLQAKYSALKSGIILGIIWGIWHLPLHFISGTSQEFVPIWADIFITILLSILITWVYNNTGRSILAAMLFHWAANTGAILFPYWQLGAAGIKAPNLWVPTTGMYIGFVVLLAVVVGVILLNRNFRQIKTKT